MKYCFQLIICLTLSGDIFSQENLAGLWYSEDSSRIYNLHKTDSGFVAVIFSSNRKHDYEDALILNNISFNQEKNIYSAVIYSVFNSPPLCATMQLSDDNKILLIRIPRMYIFPVHIKWVRKHE